MSRLIEPIFAVFCACCLVLVLYFMGAVDSFAAAVLVGAASIVAGYLARSLR